MRFKGEGVESSLKAMFIKAGPGIFTGGITTAMAFLTLLIARTDGLQEFGLVLGVGIIMTMLAAILILPNLLVIRERVKAKFGWEKISKPRDISYKYLGSFANGLSKYRKFSLIGIGILVIFLGYRGSEITMDYNFLNMQAEGLESVELQDRMIDELGISSDFALITAETLEEVNVITKKAKDMSTSGMVQSIVDFLPPEDEQIHRSDVVSEIRNTMSSKSINNKIDLNILTEELYRLAENIMEIQDMAYIGGQDKVYLKSALLVGALPDDDDPSLKPLNEKLSIISDDIYQGLLIDTVNEIDVKLSNSVKQMNTFQNDFAISYMSKTIQMANPEKIGLLDLPSGIKDQYVGKSEKNYLVSIFPKRNVWDIDFLKRYSGELAAVDQRATGIPPIFNTLMDEIGEDGGKATKLAILVIFIVLLIDFRNLKKVVLAMIPLVVGVLWMVGIMELTGLQITLLNIMAIPMIIGIGIDDGVHIVHRYQIEGLKSHRKVFASTGRAVFLTSITTMVGFGSLWFATYRGLGSMGIALFIGVGACFLATVFVIPALLGRSKKNSKKDLRVN